MRAYRTYNYSTDNGSNLAGSRALSSLSARRDSPAPRDTFPNIMNRPTTDSPLSSGAMPQQPSPDVRTPSQVDIHQARQTSVQSSPSSSPSSNSGSSSPSPAAPSRLSRRPPQFAPHRDKRNLSDDDDEDDDEPAFMPLSSTTNDPSATLRDDARNAARRPARGKGEVSQMSDSSTSSTSPVLNRGLAGQRRTTPGPLSPRRTAELSARKESSDGTPSMGSSFSDLDGTSPRPFDGRNYFIYNYEGIVMLIKTWQMPRSPRARWRRPLRVICVQVAWPAG